MQLLYFLRKFHLNHSHFGVLFALFLLGGCGGAVRPEAPLDLFPEGRGARAQALQGVAVLPPAAVATDLDSIHRWVNRVPFRSDKRVWGRDDYWASPQKFFRYGGDCEDYMIAKHAVLRALGWPESSLQMLIVYDLWKGRQHAILAVTLKNGHVFWLDNQSKGLVDAAIQQRYQPLARVLVSGDVVAVGASAFGQ